jgi:hypothetical protein
MMMGRQKYDFALSLLLLRNDDAASEDERRSGRLTCIEKENATSPLKIIIGFNDLGRTTRQLEILSSEEARPSPKTASGRAAIASEPSNKSWSCSAAAASAHAIQRGQNHARRENCLAQISQDCIDKHW